MADAKKVDLSALLSKPADDVKAPPPFPPGTYFGQIKSYEYGKSKVKETPYIRYHVAMQNPGEDVNPSDLEGIDLGAKAFHYDFYLTDSSEYIVFEMLESAGISKAGRSKGEVLADGIGLAVICAVVQNTSGDGKRIYANIDSMRANV